ncbi:oxidoreductase [Knoellia sinensis KCTC 19936]|uniref:Oxidoreductase n=1 Tax=Knoellia sinensis KCTC 19936 TaxID=1385520 RepID=A0A0A0J9Q3_9MICO|nr:FAD-binding oxidoreductase [Knoellia sinensis]KGN34165.1 oxidoreductase [Knoellia sinensis KCTC 19936]
MSAAVDSTSLADRLDAVVDGEVTAPGDAAYDEARQVFAAGIDKHPEAIVRPAHVDDVAAVVALAREFDIELAVRGGGHSGAGHGTSDGVVLDLGELKDLDIDVEGRTAWAGAGLTAGEFTTAVAEHGLAAGFGDAGVVGIGGITLGGGVGFLSRAHGLTIDNLLAAQVVTANGERLHVDADNHPDLFWALRGGGGNFGVVTRFQFRLHEVGQVHGGMLMLAATPSAMRSVVRAAEAAPDELSLIINVMSAPPMPFIPEALHGSTVIMVVACWSGAVDEGERVLAPLRASGEVLADMIEPIPYAALLEDEVPARMPFTVAGRSAYTEEVTDAAIRAIIEQVSTSDAALKVVHLRLMGGAIDRVEADATAYAHRGARFMTNVASSYDGAEDRREREAWISGLAELLEVGQPGVYVNFLADDGAARLEEAYPPHTLKRLREIKAAYDPDNVFQVNHNISPTA